MHGLVSQLDMLVSSLVGMCIWLVSKLVRELVSCISKC